MATETTSVNAPLLEMRGVDIADLHDAARIVVRGVNWTVHRGDYWAIGGLHGSGKTNFIFATAGVLPPAQGRYLAFGAELTPGYEHEQIVPRLRIGTVFDGGRLLHHLSIAENVALPLRYHQNLSMAAAAPIIDPLLDFVGMGNRAAALPGSISRNWQQRAGLARALVMKPEVLLFDTPLSGLDPREMVWWLDTIDKLAAGHPLLDGKPATIVVTTDDLRRLATRARQFAVLKNRQLAFLSSQEISQGPEWQADDSG